MTELENLKGIIAAVSMNEIRMAVLKDEILVAESRLQPHDTGHLHDYIGRLKDRIEELETTPSQLGGVGKVYSDGRGGTYEVRG